MENFIVTLNKYSNGTKILVEWENSLRVKAELDTIFETDNGLEMDDDGYEEYYACLLRIISIEDGGFDELSVKEGSLLEVSKMNEPTRIFLEEKRELIWHS